MALGWGCGRQSCRGKQADQKAGSLQEAENPKIHTYIRDALGDFISGGLTGVVELLDDGTVIKAPFPGPDWEIEEKILDIAKEAGVYHRIGPHERLVRLISHSRAGLVLEYMEKGDLQVYLEAHDSSSIPMTRKLKWEYQAAEALELLHSHNILHCDTKPRNFLLDAEFTKSSTFLAPR
ncbi:hypothetical protein AJ79_03761 [Helicocarpus griseus UAMH5409]|uniref:Protein kinase domain-containing protein n=1 Tax=Helicocarpus griseus UAMH5409 TaxID=1447875 RepID=A0A2B7XNJ2_9EURO|nr:hypothetical protein AJ79_03761 [Helicocarpus griseus UAMH5409]